MIKVNVGDRVQWKHKLGTMSGRVSEITYGVNVSYKKAMFLIVQTSRGPIMDSFTRSDNKSLKVLAS